MHQYLSFVTRYAKAILAVLFAATVYFVAQLPHLTIDSNPYLLPEDHPARRSILDLQKEFTGTYDAVLIAIENERSVFNQTTLTAVYELSTRAQDIVLTEASDAAALESLAEKYPQHAAFRRQIQAVLKGDLQRTDYDDLLLLYEEGRRLSLPASELAFLRFLPERANPIRDIASLSETENVLGSEGTLVTRSSLRDRDEAADVQRVRREVLDNDMMVGGVVTRDERVSLIVVELSVKQEDAEGQLRAYARFRSLADDYRAQNPDFKDRLYIAGVPIFMAEQKALMDRDMGVLFPVVLLVTGVLLLLFFRKPLGFVLPMLNVIMCTIWTLGLMSLFRVPLDLITSALPVFLITICGADAIHIMYEYYDQRRRASSVSDVLYRTMKEMISPVVLTTVTTAVGFLVSTSMDLSSIRTFGIFMAVGLLIAQVISLLLIPAWLSLVKVKTSGAGTAEPQAADEPSSPTWLERIVLPIVARRRAAMAVFAVAIALAVFQASRIQVEDAGSEYFAKENAFRQADEFVNAHLAGTSPGWISVEATGGEDMLTLPNLRFLDECDRFVTSHPNVSYSYSLPKYVKRMNMAVNNGDRQFDTLPDDPELLRQIVFMYENAGGSDLSNVLNPSFSKSVIMFTMNTTRASEYRALLKDLQIWLASHKPSNVTVTIAGTPVIWSGVLAELLDGQKTGFLGGLGAVALVLAVWLRSIKLAFLTTLPLGLSVVFFYAFMALFGIDLNIGTGIISFLVVGIVDYAVHFVMRIRSALRTTADVDYAVLHAVRHSGSSIAFNVAIFSLGFLTLVLSEFTPIVHLGLLVAFALCLSGAMSILVVSLAAPYLIEKPAVPVESPVAVA